LLLKQPGLNTRNVWRRVGGYYLNVRNKLFDLAARKYVVSRPIRRFYPGGEWILTHSWYVTREGVNWLKKRGVKVEEPGRGEA